MATHSWDHFWSLITIDGQRHKYCITSGVHFHQAYWKAWCGHMLFEPHVSLQWLHCCIHFICRLSCYFTLITVSSSTTSLVELESFPKCKGEAEKKSWGGWNEMAELFNSSDNSRLGALLRLLPPMRSILLVRRRQWQNRKAFLLIFRWISSTKLRLSRQERRAQSFRSSCPMSLVKGKGIKPNNNVTCLCCKIVSTLILFPRKSVFKAAKLAFFPLVQFSWDAFFPCHQTKWRTGFHLMLFFLSCPCGIWNELTMADAEHVMICCLSCPFKRVHAEYNAWKFQLLCLSGFHIDTKNGLRGMHFVSTSTGSLFPREVTCRCRMFSTKKEAWRKVTNLSPQWCSFIFFIQRVLGSSTLRSLVTWRLPFTTNTSEPLTLCGHRLTSRTNWNVVTHDKWHELVKAK